MSCCRKFPIASVLPLSLGVMTFVVAMGVIHHAARNRRSIPETTVIAAPPPPGLAVTPTLPGLSADRKLDSSGAWAQTLGKTYPADVYPSAREAARGLALQVPLLLRQLNLPDNAKITLRDEPGVSASLLREFASFDATGAIQSPGGDLPQPQDASATLAVDLASGRRVEWSAEPSASGSMTLAVETKAGPRATASARFEQKTWLDSSLELAGQPAHRWMVAHSATPAGSAEEAIRLAQEAASADLVPLLHQPQRGVLPRRAAQAQVAQRQIDQALHDGRLAADRFVQEFQTSYGKVWHAAILIDASDATMRRIAAQTTAQIGVEHRQQRSAILSVAGVVLVVVSLYLVLNAVTKGYFTWRLRGLAAVATLATVLAAIMMLS